MYRILVNIFSVPATWLIASFLGWALIFMAFDALATGKTEITIGEYYESVTHNYYYDAEDPASVTATSTPVTSITAGVSDSDLAKGLSGAMAIGGHSWDYSTQQLQTSVTAAVYQSETGFSIGVAKRWDKVDAMFHGAITEIDSDYAGVIGATWRW